MGILTHYLGWDRPFSIALAGRLAEESEGGRELDSWLLMVPSARAGRHVLAELFTKDAEGTEAFHPPRMMTPAQFVNSLTASPDAADELRQLHTWQSVLQEADSELLKDLFPVQPRENRTQWAYSIARQLMGLRDRLVEDGHDFRSIAQNCPSSDRDRWQTLARIEESYLELLHRQGLTDPPGNLDAGLDRALAGFPYERVMVAGILNLSHRQAHCLERLAGNDIRVDLFLPIPKALGKDFDRWGCPEVGKWERRPVPGELLNGALQRSVEPRPLIKSALGLAREYRDNVDSLVLGVPDPELAEFLVEQSLLSETPVYPPEGKSFAQTSWGRLIRKLREWQSGKSLVTLQELLRHSVFRRWAFRRAIPVTRMEIALDRLRREKLFLNARQLEDAQLFPSRSVGIVRDGLESVDSLLQREGEETFPDWLWSVLCRLAGDESLSTESREVLDGLEEVLADVKENFPAGTLREEDYQELLEHVLSGTRYYPEREAAERPVSGWLELPWERAPHMVILGLPDHRVPGSDGLESFLTPALCRELSLYGPDQSAAFHAFRLRYLLESRRSWGRLDLLVADRGLDGHPVLPSRFLFLAEEAETTKRVELLLGDRPVPEYSLPAVFGNALELPPPPDLEKLRVTDFAAYLRNPFHCYIERILGWSLPEPAPRELDSLAFGSLAHRILESLNSSAEGKELVGEKDILDYLHHSLDATMAGLFGKDPGVAVRIQADSLRERLAAVSAVIASERRAGWLPVHSEWAIHDQVEFDVSGIRIRGIIDLLEHNQETGAYRIIDYKTSDKNRGAHHAHLARVTTRSAAPLFPAQDFSHGDKEWRWKDLQLPLYRMAVEQVLGCRPECAYVCLTKAVQDIRLDPWTPDEDHDTAALACAEAIIGQIRKGNFPVPGRPAYGDDWLPWFGGDYRKVIDAGWLEKHGEARA